MQKSSEEDPLTDYFEALLGFACEPEVHVSSLSEQALPKVDSFGGAHIAPSLDFLMDLLGTGDAEKSGPHISTGATSHSVQESTRPDVLTDDPYSGAHIAPRLDFLMDLFVTGDAEKRGPQISTGATSQSVHESTRPDVLTDDSYGGAHIAPSFISSWT